jgi:hypothetical protein
MVDIVLLLMAIASAASLLVVSPRDLQKKAILALREYEEMELSHASGREEGGQVSVVDPSVETVQLRDSLAGCRR